jgi:hypothetical protein
MHPVMTRPSQTTTTDLLETELATITGSRCGWTCQDHHAETFPATGCERAPNHTGAERLIDVHLAHNPGGQIVTATECCPANS